MEALFLDSFQESSGACAFDVTPPTFAGIASLVPGSNGSLLASWLVATGTPTPLEYDVYIALGTVTAPELFVDGNRVHSTYGLTIRLWTLADGNTLLAQGQAYTVGVRARDRAGNIETNVVVLTATSTGVIPDNLTAAIDDLQDATEALQNLVTPGGCEVEIEIEETPELQIDMEECS